MESMFRGTTICGVKRDGKIAIAGDGQVTLSESVIFKSNAHKVRRIYDDKVVIGFAGSVADAFSLCERFENMLKGLFSDILKEYGYDENGNKIAGYAVSNNAPLAVHEPVASYGTNETSEDEEDVVEDDDEFDENETEEEEVRPGFKEIHVTLNGKKITVPPRRKDRGGAYHDVTELFDYTLKEEDRHDKVLKLFVKINGKVVRGREEWQKACAVIREGDVIEFAYKVVE